MNGSKSEKFPERITSVHRIVFSARFVGQKKRHINNGGNNNPFRRAQNICFEPKKNVKNIKMKIKYYLGLKKRIMMFR